MATNDRPKRRARRIAADEAHAWARNLRLGNLQAKMVLSMLSLYVDGEGCAYVSIPSLAEDCELSDQTVRRRLSWLEEIGAIARIPQWIDRNGRRCSNEGGKRTTDLIRLLYVADQDEIEARAAGQQVETDAGAAAVSPIQQIGLNPAPDPVSPALALRQPYQCGEGLISEPDPESPLKSPPGTNESAAPIEASEPEHFGPAWSAWPGHEVMRRDLALAEFRQLEPAKQLLCRAAIPLFAQLQAKLGRKHPPNFHLWIRSRGFEEFPDATLANPTAPPPRHWLGESQAKALGVALRIADRAPPRLLEDPERGRGLWRLMPCEPDLAALGQVADQDPAGWRLVRLGSPQFAAWRDRLQAWLGGTVEGERIWLEDYDPAVHGRPAMDPLFRLRRSDKALRVPAEWPPHRDGSWPLDQSSEVA